MTRFAFAASVGLYLLAAASRGDSLTTRGGKTYENVYIDKGDALYYVRDPATGTVENIRTEDVQAGSVVLSSRKTRDALLERWKSKQPESGLVRGVRGSSRESGGPNRMPTKADAAKLAHSFRVNPDVSKHGIESYEQNNGVLHLTNRPDRLRERAKGKTVYVDQEGVGVLTNLHERFRNNDEYVAVHIAFEAIEVPERFMKGSAGFVSAELDEMIRHYAKKNRLDPYLVYAVIRQESNFNANAVSRAGASGLMQLMPGTAAEMGVDDIFNPAQNIAGGTQYLAKMLRMFDNDTTLALAGYNAGPGNVLKHNGVPPFEETRNYVKRVTGFHQQYARGGAPNIKVAAAKHGPGGLAALPPENSEYIQFVLKNGAVTPAERMEEKETYYTYEFKHTTGVVQKRFVKEVIYPVKPAD